MARDWIKWVKGLSQRREVLVIARNLGLSRREAACACMEVWEWADSETPDGFVKGASGEDIDLMLGIPGFAAALQAPEVGWLVVRAGGITFPRYERNNGESAKRRAVEAHKKSRQRDLKKSKPSRSRPDKRPDDVPPRAAPEKRREILKPSPPTPAFAHPSAPDPPPLSAAWSEVVVVAADCGVGNPEAACESARDRGASPAQVRALCEHFAAHPGAWGAGLLFTMIARIRPDQKPSWPAPSAEYQERQRVAVQVAKHEKRESEKERQLREREERRLAREKLDAENAANPFDVLGEFRKAIQPDPAPLPTDSPTL